MELRKGHCIDMHSSYEVEGSFIHAAAAAAAAASEAGGDAVLERPGLFTSSSCSSRRRGRST